MDRKNLEGLDICDWRVLEKGKKYGRGELTYLCQCKCGLKKDVRASQLIRAFDGLNGGSPRCRACANKIAAKKRIIKMEGISSSYWNRYIVCGAKKRNIPVSISREYAYDLLIRQDFKCALTGLEITLPKSSKELKSKKTTASLDRIDSGFGYSEGNVQWVHTHINIMKLDHSQKYFIDLCKKVAEFND